MVVVVVETVKSCIANGVRQQARTHQKFGGLELLLGYFATSSAKSDIIFLLATPISYKGDEIPAHLA